MSLPGALTLVPVHGRILHTDPAGTPAAGSVAFRIDQPLRDAADAVILAPTTLLAVLDEAGEFTISLPATDDPQISPSGWTYGVRVSTDAWSSSFRVEVPSATPGTLELADLAPAVTPPEVATYVLLSTVGQPGGPAGPLDDEGLIPVEQVPGGGGGSGPSPSITVVSGTSPGASPSAGAASTYSRGDHSHGTPPTPTAAQVGAEVSGTAASTVAAHAGAADPHGDRAYADTVVAGKPSLASTTPAASAVGDAGATGAGTTAARADHVHGREAFGAVSTQTSYGANSANGTAATPARSDHTHGTPPLTSAAPTASAVGDAAAVGAATAPARADHTHGREAAGTPGASAVGDTAAAGSAGTVARSDHRHGRESFGSVTAQTSFGAASGNGSASTPARSDHAHGTPVQDPLVLLRNAMVPSGRVETRSRLDSGVTSSAVTSGTLYLIPIWLPAGTVVSSISFVAGNTGFSTLTNQWFSLHDSSRVQLAVTSNDGSTAWAAQATKTLNIATTAAGAASSFTTTYSGVHYLGFMVTASTMSNMAGGGAGGAAMENAAPAFGACNTGLTTPQAFPFTATAPTGAGPLFYAWVA